MKKRAVDVGCDVSEERAFARGEVEMIKRGGEECVRGMSDEGIAKRQ